MSCDKYNFKICLALSKTDIVKLVSDIYGVLHVLSVKFYSLRLTRAHYNTRELHSLSFYLKN